MGFINDWRLLAFCRVLLGLFEAGEFSTIRADRRVREMVDFFLGGAAGPPPGGGGGGGWGGGGGGGGGGGL